MNYPFCVFQVAQANLNNKLNDIISGIPDEATRQAVQVVVDKLQEHQRKTGERFQELEGFIKPDDRLREQEWYSRKNYTILENHPFDATKPETEWLPKILAFLNILIEADIK